MARHSKISWTSATFNPWIGCTKVSPGCDNCYAEAFDNRLGGGLWGKGAPRRTFGEKHWSQLFKWQKEAKDTGTSLYIFVASMADVMDDEAPAGELQRLYDHINECPDLTFQLLTKRPHRYAERLPVGGFRHGNVWLGTTCENQHFYDIRWPILHRVSAAMGLVSWISYEPAIVTLSMKNWSNVPDWIICGGESGADSKRRPMELAWAENVRDECLSSGTKFFMKQLSARTPDKGKELILADLLIQQFPITQQRSDQV